MRPPAIETENLSKRYGDETAIDGVELSIPSGEIYGFLGPNGAGKSTTIRILTTLTNPTSGDAFVEGVPVTDRDEVLPHIGYLPEEPPVYKELTGREQIEYIAGLQGVEDRSRVDDLLERLSLAEDADRQIEGYSKGMKQKVALVQALLHDPDVLFLDEPTSGLDPRAARTVRDLIAEIAAEETTVFLSTHILPVVEELADRVGVLYEGSLVAEGPPAELTDRREDKTDDTLEDVFLEVTSERSGEPTRAGPEADGQGATSTDPVADTPQ
jgi:ABC-2 type transport system ATP-binding protein